MSIAEKLTYLQTTKQLLKTEINKINNVLTDESTFRSYPQELFNGYLDVLNNGTDTLWNNLEKVSASGEEATLENVETAPMKMVLNGNTSQDTTSGKNLLKLGTGETHLGITSVINANGSISYSGTAESSYCKLGTEVNVNIPAGKYAFSRNERLNYGTRILITFEDNTTTNPTIASGNLAATFTTTQTIKKIQVYLIALTANTTYNGTQYLQLESGSSATSWEKYTGGQPSPSPDYPQEVKVVTGENVVSVSGKNLLPFANQDFTIKGVRFYCQDGDLYIDGTSTGEITTNSSAFKDNFKFTLKAGRYSVSTIKDTRVKYIKKYSDNSNLVLFGGNSWIGGFTLDVDTEVYLGIYIANGGVNNNAKQNAMLWNYQDSSDYVPYSKTDYPISLGIIEMCKINTYKDYFHKDSGKWYVHKAIEKVVLDGNEQMNFQGSESTPTERTIFRWTLPTYALTTDYLSNKFIKGPSTSNRIVMVGGSNRPYISIDNLLVGINTKDDNNTKLAKFKTWLSNNNVTLYYVLATPTEEEITNTTLIEQLEAIFKAKSIKDKTYITQTNDELPFILDVEAIKEYSVE